MRKRLLFLFGVILLFSGCAKGNYATEYDIGANQEEDVTTIENVLTEGTEVSEVQIVENTDSGQEETIFINSTISTKTETTKEVIKIETTSSESSSDRLSDDLNSFQFQIDGKVYSLPIPYKDLTALGWKQEGNETTEIPSRSFEEIDLKKGDLTVTVTIANWGERAIPIYDLSVVDITFDDSYNKGNSDKIAMPKNIILSKSNYSEVISSYGPPLLEYQGSEPSGLKNNQTIFVYWDDNDLFRGIFIILKDNIVSRIYLSNRIGLKAAVEADLKNAEPTPEVLAYKAPKELGFDVTSIIVEIEGDLNQLPAPLTEFQKNGWTIEPNYYTVIPPQDGVVYGVTLLRGDKRFIVYAENVGTKDIFIRNAFIGSIHSYLSHGLSFKLPKGISMGSSKDDLLIALHGTDYVMREVGDSEMYFIYRDIKDQTKNFIMIEISKETGCITEISINH